MKLFSSGLSAFRGSRRHGRCSYLSCAGFRFVSNSSSPSPSESVAELLRSEFGATTNGNTRGLTKTRRKPNESISEKKTSLLDGSMPTAHFGAHKNAKFGRPTNDDTRRLKTRRPPDKSIPEKKKTSLLGESTEMANAGAHKNSAKDTGSEPLVELKHHHGVTPPQQQVPCTKSSQEIIKLLIDRVNTQSWIELDKDIRIFGIELKIKEVAWVLKVLKNPTKAWDFFKWAAQRPGYTHDPTCYACMIDLLGQVSDHGLLEDLLAEMETRKIQYNVTTINRLIGIYAANEDIDKAEQFFLKLQKLGMEPTAYTYKCMLQAFAKAGKCEKALAVYRVMKTEQQPLDIISYNMLLDRLSRNNQVESVLNIFKEMEHYGNIADVYTYTILARTYGHAGMVGKALDLLEEMAKKGVQPNRHTYNTILDALVRSQDKLEDAITLFKKMSGCGIHPDAASCQSILKVLCNARQVGRTIELAQCIKEKAARKEVYECFIKVLGKMGYLRQVRTLFQSLKADNVRPSQATCLSMIDALCRGMELDEAMVILKDTEKNGGPLPLNTYNSVLAALRNGNQFQAAYDLFNKMKERGPSPDVVSYNIVIAGLAKSGKLSLAEGLFEEMDKHGCIPNVITFNSLLHSFARLGDVCSTRRLLQMMHANEVTPDIITYNSTIECFGRAGKPNVALKVFKEMKEKGCSPSFVTYNNVLLTLARAGLIDEVMSLFEQMKEQGFVPDAMTFTILGRLYDSNRHLDKRQLVEEIRKAGLAHELIV